MTGPESKRAEYVGASKSQPEAARYIADLTGEMVKMARGSGFDVIAYLLELARLEAEETAQKLATRRVVS
jgi:hypothetical protein